MRPAARVFALRALDFQQAFAFERSRSAPAHRRIFLQRIFVDIHRQRLVAPDVDGAKDDGTVARCVEHVAVEPLLPPALRQRRRHEELEFGAEEADAAGAGRSSAATSSRSPALIISSIGTPSLVTAGRSRSDAVRAALSRDDELGIEGVLYRLRRADVQRAGGGIEEASYRPRISPDVADAAQHGDVYRTRDDDDVRGQRPSSRSRP